MVPLAHGDIGSADEIAISFAAFILLLVVIGIVIRDSWRNRKREHQSAQKQESELREVD